MNETDTLRAEWIELHCPDITHLSSRPEPWWLHVVVDKPVFGHALRTFHGMSWREVVDKARAGMKVSGGLIEEG